MFASHVHSKVIEGNPERVPSRNGYGEGLLEAGKRDDKVVALCCDLTESTKTDAFAKAFPKRFLQVGVAEQNLASVGSGMAAMGKIPFIASYAAFSPGRNWEQIRTTIAYNNSNVKIIGAHAGITVGPDGATHQMTEDIAIMRAMPNMIVLVPCDVHEARKMTLAAAMCNKPVYIRLGRSETPVVTTPDSPFEIGKAQIMYTRKQELTRKIGIVSTGLLLYNALQAAEQLQSEGIGASVLHVATIKPLDTEALKLFAQDHDALVTVEEHQITGGLGGAVAEYLSEVKPTRIAMIGMRDVFGQSGDPEELLVHYKMDTPSIVEAAKALVV